MITAERRTLSVRMPASGERKRSRTILSAVVSTADLAALSVAMLVVFPTWTARGGAFAALAFLLLRIGPTSQARVRLVVDDEIPMLAGRLAAALFFLVLLNGSAGAFDSVLIKQFPLSVVSIMVGRATAYAVVRRINRSGRGSKRTIIVGAGLVGVDIAGSLARHPEYGMTPIGFVDDVNDIDGPVGMLGQVHELERLMEAFDVQRVVVAFGLCREPDLVGVLRAAAHRDVEVFVVPRFFELGTGRNGAATDSIWGIPVVRLPSAAMRRRTWLIKRMFDVSVASALLLLSAPVLALMAIAVRLSSPGPVFFRQERVGVKGRAFNLLKFRSLRVNNDSDTTWSVADDDRQTGIGRLLRRTSLDELPQLINVVRGDMSLVGPRPERPHFVEEFRASVPAYDDRHRVLVGMTGWAQVNGLRGDSSIEERARFDNQYIEQWSLWKDLVILARTIPAVVSYALRQSGGGDAGLPGPRSLPRHASDVASTIAGRPAAMLIPALASNSSCDSELKLKHVN